MAGSGLFQMRQTIQEGPPAKQNNSPVFHKFVRSAGTRKSLPMRQKDGKTLLHAKGRRGV